MKTLTDNRSFELAADIYRKEVAAGTEILNLGLVEIDYRACPVCDFEEGKNSKFLVGYAKNASDARHPIRRWCQMKRASRLLLNDDHLNSKLWKNSENTIS